VTFAFGTLCSGIEAASEAFLPLGAECRYVSEIEPFPCGVLAIRHGASKPLRMPRPEDAATEDERKARIASIKAIDKYVRPGNRIPNFGDLTQIDPEELPAVDLLVAGFPCQDFSIAGLRQSLAGARGNLTLFGVKLIHELVRLRRIRSVLLEQVPDILNTRDNAFGALLGGLVGHDAPIVPGRRGKWTNSGVADGPFGTAVWRVEDAQYSGLAQRRERLFLVASFGAGPDPVSVLLERQGLSRHPPTRRKAHEDLAGTVTTRAGNGSRQAGASGTLVADGPQRRAAFGGNNTSGPVDLATARTASHTASGRQDFESETFIVEGADLAGTLQASGKAAGSATQQDAESGLLVPVAYSIMPMNSGRDYKAREVDVAQPLMAAGPVGGNQGGDYVVHAGVAFNARQTPISDEDVTGPLEATSPQAQAIAFSCKDHGGDAGELSPTLRSMGHANSHPNAGGQVAVAFSLRGREDGAQAEVEAGDVSPSLRAADGGSTRPFVAFQGRGSNIDLGQEVTGTLAQNADRCSGGAPCIADAMAVRRITVVEACRLQGFSDFYTLIEWPTANRKGQDLEEQIAYLISHGFSPEDAERLAQTPDGPQYKAIGNSKPVPTVRKIGAAYAAALTRYLASKEASA
jgi:DNA (cytosine-5)-methyltransferase 1